MQCITTELFGAPMGNPNRMNTAIQGIAIHAINDSFDGALNAMCLSSKRSKVGCHQSFHYLIDGNGCQVAQIVPEANLAWAFQSYRTNFPVTTPLDCCPCPPPCPLPPCPTDPCGPVTYTGWPTLSAANPNLSADFYTINIGIALPARPEITNLDGIPCCGPFGMEDCAYQNLIRLLAWIESRYPVITNDIQHVAFHDQIVVREQECLEIQCPGPCLLCDVSSYCERCRNMADPTILIISDPAQANQIRYFYGETIGGCRIKFTLDVFIQMLRDSGNLIDP